MRYWTFEINYIEYKFMTDTNENFTIPSIPYNDLSYDKKKIVDILIAEFKETIFSSSEIIIYEDEPRYINFNN